MRLIGDQQLGPSKATDRYDTMTLIGAFGVGVVVTAIFFGVGVTVIDGSRTVFAAAIIAVVIVGLLTARLTRAAAKTRQALRTVSSRERRLTTITKTLNDVVFISNADRQMVFVSGSIKRVFGVTVEEFLARPLIDRVHPDDRAVFQRAGEQLRSLPAATTQFEFRAEVAPGDWRWLDARGINLLDHPDLQGVITSVQDVTGPAGCARCPPGERGAVPLAGGLVTRGRLPAAW